MAEKTWLGGTSTDFDTAANWSGGTVPVDGDDLLFVDDTDFACTQNMDRSATLQNDYPNVTIGPEYNHDLGTAADPLYTGITNLRWEGPRTGYFRANDYGTPDLPIVNATQKNGRLFLDLRGTAVQTTLVNIEAGTCEISDGRVTTIQVNGRLPGGANLVILAAVDLLTNLVVNNGTVTTSFASHESIDIVRGSVNFKDAAACTTGSAEIDNKRGLFLYNSSGTITSYINRSGAVFSARTNKNDATPTITNMTSYGGTIDLRNPRGNITLTNGVDNYDADTRIFFPEGKTITITDI